MSKSHDKLPQVRVYPENLSRLEDIHNKTEFRTTLAQLANEAMEKGLDAVASKYVGTKKRQ